MPGHILGRSKRIVKTLCHTKGFVACSQIMSNQMLILNCSDVIFQFNYTHNILMLRKHHPGSALVFFPHSTLDKMTILIFFPDIFSVQKNTQASKVKVMQLFLPLEKTFGNEED